MAVVIYGTVSLSSQIFISLGDAVPIITRYLGGTIACRLVVRYEVYGLRYVSSQNVGEFRTEGQEYGFIEKLDKSGDMYTHVVREIRV